MLVKGNKISSSNRIVNIRHQSYLNKIWHYYYELSIAMSSYILDAKLILQFTEINGILRVSTSQSILNHANEIENKS